MSGFISHRQLAREAKRKKKKVIFMSEGLDEVLGYASDYPTWEQSRYFSSRKIQLFASKLLSSSRYTRSILRKLGMNKFSYQSFRFKKILFFTNTQFKSF